MAGEPRGKPSGKPGTRDPLAKLSQDAQTYVEGLATAGRKRRKDAIGRKQDYHKGSVILAVRLPEDVANQVRALAQAEEVTVNAWLAALIERTLNESGKP
jgi:predicted HicB family RNase H-like nuclease